MVWHIIKSLVKWPLVVGPLVCGMYAYHSNIEKFVNGFKYSNYKSELGFVEKDMAMNLEIGYQINKKGYIETYLKVHNDKIPLYMRDNGIMVGDSEYCFGNINSKERKILCSGIIPEDIYKKLKSEKPRTKEAFRSLQDLLE
jgi:hypothetical protein